MPNQTDKRSQFHVQTFKHCLVLEISFLVEWIEQLKGVAFTLYVEQWLAYFIYNAKKFDKL